MRSPARASGGNRTYQAWAGGGITRADGQPFPQPNAIGTNVGPVPGGPAFLFGANFYAVRSYNPSMNYALAICHLGDRSSAARPSFSRFPAPNAR